VIDPCGGRNFDNFNSTILGIDPHASILALCNVNVGYEVMKWLCRRMITKSYKESCASNSSSNLRICRGCVQVDNRLLQLVRDSGHAAKAGDVAF
jgi:hypothetical protein